MPITEKFAAIPHDFDRLALPRKPNRDGKALYNLQKMSDLMSETPEITYGWGSWGWTILRTVYDDESDAVFHAAVEKLRRWTVGYWIHYNRFCGFSEEDQARAEKRSDGSANDALGDRFRLEVLEDRDRLNMPDLETATVDDIQALCDRFHEWVASVGEDPTARPPLSPRLCSFLVIDSKALADLAAVPEEIPPRQVALNFEEFMRRRRSAMYGGWAWFVEPRAVKLYREGLDSNPRHRGWMKIGAELIESAWFTLVWSLVNSILDENPEGMIECYENPTGSGTFWYHGDIF